MHLSPARKGELFIFTEAFLWSFFPVMTLLSYGTLMPLSSAAISTFISSLFFALVLTIRKRWHEILEQSAWMDILLTSVLIGVIFYGLLFTALRSTTAGNAAIMGQMEVFFSFLILGVFLKHERITLPHLLGGAAMVLGAMLILLPQGSGWHVGDLLVMLATAIAPLGNVFTQRARRIVSAETILFVRSIISGLCFFLLSVFMESLPSFDAAISSAMFLFLNGFLLLGFSKILWIEATNLIPITKAISLASIGPFFTLLFAYLLLHEQMTPIQALGFLPIFIGVLLLTQKFPGEKTESMKILGDPH